MATKVPDITITSIETINAFDVTSGNYLWTLDELQNATLSQSQETSDVTGKAGRKISTLKRNKAVSISATNGLISGGLLESQTGGEFENKETEVLWTETLSVTSAAASTTWVATGTEGAEIEALYVRNADGTLGEQMTQDATASAGKFTYNPETKALGFHTDVADGTEVVVIYKRTVKADVLVNDSDKYSGRAALYIDALGEDKCNNIYRIQIYVPKADISGEWSMEFGDSQSVHAFDAEALSGACGTGGWFFTYTVFGVDAADVTA